MEGFSLESKLGSCWGFDPVCSSDVLLMPHARLKSIICEHEASSSIINQPFSTSTTSHNISTSDKFNPYHSLTLTSLTPFHLLDQQEEENNNNLNNNNNNNNNTNSNDIHHHPSCSTSPSLPLHQQQAVGFLTLDPLLVAGGDVTEDEDQDRVQILTNCFSTNKGEDEGLPKFEEIHLISSSENGNFQYPNSDEEADPNGHSSSEGQGIYFDIQNLSSYHQNGETSTEFGENKGDGGDFLMEDLGDCVGELEQVEGHTLIVQEDEKEDEEEDESLEVDPDDDEEFTTSITDDKSVVVDDDAEDGDENGGVKAELKCKFCGFVCCSKSSLGIHERRHTGERPFSCKHCGRLFNSAQCCKHHERLHTGDKPFECQYCGKKYAVSTRLKRHERVHTREEPYKCMEPGCNKTFRWFDAFRDHRNTHNGVPLYLCSVCGKSFTSYLKFYYHERGHFLKRERDKIKQNKSTKDNNNIEAQKGGPKTNTKKSKLVDQEGIKTLHKGSRKVLQNNKAKKEN